MDTQTHTRNYNYAIPPIISSPTSDNFSLKTLPSYDNVIRQQKLEEESESSLPRYDEIVFI